jgi:hypothetical protein
MSGNMALYDKSYERGCDHYRTAVTLLCTTYKNLVNILYVVLVPYAEEIIGELPRRLEREDEMFIKFFTMREI